MDLLQWGRPASAPFSTRGGRTHNPECPHSRLGWLTPAGYAPTFPRRSPRLRDPTSSVSSLAAPLAQADTTHRRTQEATDKGWR